MEVLRSVINTRPSAEERAMRDRIGRLRKGASAGPSAVRKEFVGIFLENVTFYIYNAGYKLLNNSEKL